MSADVPIERRTLQKLKVGATVVESLRHQRSTVDIQGELVHRLSAYVLADKIADETFTGREWVEWPETTWQMFKSRHARSWWLGWLVRRRPVRMWRQPVSVEVAVERWLTYPEAAIRMPSLGAPVVLEQVRQVPR